MGSQYSTSAHTGMPWGLHVWALHITNLLARCPGETYVPYPLPRANLWTKMSMSNGVDLDSALCGPARTRKVLRNKTILCRYKAMKVCLGARGQTSHGLTLEESDTSENRLTKCLKN